MKPTAPQCCLSACGGGLQVERGQRIDYEGGHKIQLDITTTYKCRLQVKISAKNDGGSGIRRTEEALDIVQ